MRRSTVAALLLVAAASSSQCSDSPAPVGVLPSPNGSATRSSAPFSNSGSVLGDGAETSGPVSSISKLTVTMVSDGNGDGRPNRGDVVTFTIATTQTWSRVGIVCSQNGTEVLRAVRTATAWSPITLTSETWQAGAADCVATLDQVEGKNVLTLATAAFVVAA